MTDANIKPFFVLNYTNYLNNSRYPLTKSKALFTENLKLIDDFNPEYTLVLIYIMKHMKSSSDMMEAITFEFPKDWYNGRFARGKASKMLSEMSFQRIIRKVSTAPKDWSYYVNPCIFNVLTASQRQEYYDQCQWIFPM